MHIDGIAVLYRVAAENREERSVRFHAAEALAVIGEVTAVQALNDLTLESEEFIWWSAYERILHTVADRPNGFQTDADFHD